MNSSNHVNAFSRGVMFTFGSPLTATGTPSLHYQGRRLDCFIPTEQWRVATSRLPSRFGCEFCHEPVLGFSLADKPGVVVLTCRCTVIQFEAAKPFDTQLQWSQWQRDYLREMADPAPMDELKAGWLSGSLNQQASDWLSRRFGAPEGLTFHLSGIITAGESALSHSADGSLFTTMDFNKSGGALKIQELIDHMVGSSAIPPERIVIAGRDPDYIWPEGTLRSQIKRMPFRCSDCGAWVKGAPLDWPAYDRVLGCLCHVIEFRKDISLPENYREWRALLETEKTGRLEHDARNPKHWS